MPKDKLGNQLTWRKYMQRWKQGIDTITPLQQANITIRGTLIIIIGLLAGIVFSIMAFKNLWWLMIILIGGLFNTIVSLIGTYQKKRILEKMFAPHNHNFIGGKNE